MPPTAIPTLLHCLTLLSDFESSNSLVRVAAAVPQFALMYLEKQTRTTMWKVKRKLWILSFCFENLEQNENKITFMYVIQSVFALNF